MEKPFSSYLLLMLMLIASCQQMKRHFQGGTQPGEWAILEFEKADSVNPILTPGTGEFMDPIRMQKVAWEEKDVFNPAIVVKDNKVYMLYRAQDKIGLPGGTSRIGLAES